ncbi:RNA polymerase sigma-70 factor [Limibacter armeniacum]|uniref:RNA polymerase sigma factor n=1 Tax=Limibacter armeniacum TaxID=466084 RepID=UPI002FE5FA2F
MDRLSDKELLIRLEGEDEFAFRLLYDRYANQVRIFLSRLHLDDHVDDVVQETFVTIWKKRKEINPEKSFNAYLFTIAKNFALKELKKSLTASVELEESIVPADSYNVEEAYVADELEMVIHKAIEALPERPKHVFKLKRYEGMNTEEVAKTLGISNSTVENHMNRALHTLKDSLLKASVLLLVLFIK